MTPQGVHPMNWRGYVGTVRRLPDGTVGLPGNMFSRGIGQANFGGWQACDIGKDVYRVGTVYQMESAEQRDRRVGMNPARH